MLMPPLATFSFNSGNIFTVCFFWAFAGMIAGTVANFVVRGKTGCIVGNFFLGLIGALIAGVILNFIPGLNIEAGFFATMIIASLGATLVAFLFHQVRKAEGNYQKRLLDRSR